MSYFFTTRLEIILQKISLMSQFFKEKFRLIVLLSFIFIFIVIITSYQLLVVYPLSKSEVNLDQLRALQKFEEIMDKKLKSYLKIRQWFLPRITLYSEILVPINKEELEVLQEIKAGKKDQPLLLSVTMQNKKNRNFRLTRLEQCILPNISFRKSQFQGADLGFAQLQGADLGFAQLQGADLGSAQLQGADLRYAQLQGADLLSAQLQGADLLSAQLQGADLGFAQLQGAYLHNAQLQGADLGFAQLQGADLGFAQLQGADLDSTQLQGADLRSAQLQYAFSQFRIMKKFSTAKLEKTSLIGLDNKVLDQEEIDEIMLLLTNKFISENRLKQIKQRLQRAIGKDIIQWVKSQRSINLGILTEDEFNKIANSITEPKARKRMGLPPLKKP